MQLFRLTIHQLYVHAYNQTTQLQVNIEAW